MLRSMGKCIISSFSPGKADPPYSELGGNEFDRQRGVIQGHLCMICSVPVQSLLSVTKYTPLPSGGMGEFLSLVCSEEMPFCNSNC